MPGMMFNVTKRPDELKPHGENVKIYGEENIDRDLADSIKEKGILEPLVIKDDNTIVSGHRRWLAAKNAGLEKIPCRTIVFDDDLDEVESLIEFNRQREKTYSQTMQEAEKLEEIYSERARLRQVEASHPKKGDNVVPTNWSEQHNKEHKKDRTQETGYIVPERVGMSVGSYKRARMVWTKAKEGDEDAKKIIEKVDSGSYSINKAYKEITRKEKQEQEKKDIEEKLTQIKKQTKLEDKITFLNGDFYELSKTIPDNSIDCIITDPPYPYEFIDCWSKLSEVAERVLKPSGFCIAYTGHIHLPEVMQRMGECLNFYWLCSVNHTGHASVVQGRNMIADFKPILVYQKEPFKKLPRYVHDVLNGAGREKDGHEWQQALGESVELINTFTNPGDIIYEPFAGSGTVPIACLNTNRLCTAHELDKTTYDKAFIRINESFEGMEE